MSKNTAPTPRGHQRISTANKDQAITTLQTAFAEGRLDEHEFEMRMSKVMDAKTRSDLDKLLHDLELTGPIPSGHAKRPERSLVMFSGVEHKGRFALPAHYDATAIFGGLVLDLRQAEWEKNTCYMRISAIFGGVQILIPPGIRVLVRSKPFMGGISQNISESELHMDAPTLRIQATSIFGGIEITNAR
jgi:hypothetical protein